MKNPEKMSLQILLALVALSSVAENTPSVTSLPISNCEDYYFQDDYFDITESILSLGRIDMTVLIIWEGQTQLSFPQLYFFGFESTSFSRKSLTFKDRSEAVFGQVLSRGNERIYIPWASNDLADVSRSFFESYLISSVNKIRIIVMFNPELSDIEMAADSKLSLTRVFSLLNGTYEVNLVLAEDPGYTTIKFYNFTHHSAYLKQVFNTCSNCAEHYVRRWILHINQVKKNFPAIQYDNVTVKNVNDIFSGKNFIAGQEERRKLEKLTCHLLATFADAVWETQEYTPFYFPDWGSIHNLTEKVILTLKNGSVQFKTYNQTPILKKQSHKLFLAPGTQYRQIQPEKKIKSHADQSTAAIFQDIKELLELYPTEVGSIGDLLPEKDEEYYEYKLDGSLQGIFFINNEKEKKKLLTGIHNMEDLDQEEYMIPNAVVTCLGDLMVVTGVNVTLNVKTKDCPFRMIIVKASTKVELTRSFHMPGINMFIYSPLVKSVGSHVINLSGEDCLEDLSGGDGGNFTIFMDKYEGKPLKVISNGGKGCNRLSTVAGLDPMEVTHDIFSSNDKNLNRESDVTGSIERNGKKGKIMVLSTNPNYNVIGETSNGYINESTTWKNLTDSSEVAKNYFITHLSDREKIQIFIGHVFDDKSLDGSRIIDQFYILSNYLRSPDYNTEEHRMYDPFGEVIADSASDTLKKFAMQSDFSNFYLSQRLNNRSNPEECYPLTINNYDIECAINAFNTKLSSLSREVAKKLNGLSVSVTNCLQIDLTFVREFDIVLCNVSTNEKSQIMYPLLVDEQITCYRIHDEEIVCHCKWDDSNFGKITELAADFALAVLTVRHIQINPLRMIRAPLTDFAPGSDNLDKLNEIFRETYASLVGDLQIFYEEIVKPKVEIVVTDMRRSLFHSGGNSFTQPWVADTLRWSLFIDSEIFGCTAERFHFPKMLAELALPSSDNGSLKLIQNLKEKTITARVASMALYLRIVKSQLEWAGLSAQLKGNVSTILEKFSEKIKNFVGANGEEREYNWSERGINLTFVSRLTTDFQDNFKRLEASLAGEVLGSYRREIGKFVHKQSKIMDMIQGIMSIAKDKKELESALPYVLEVTEKTNKTFHSFNIYLKLIQAFENAISEPDKYLNELYVKILQNLDSERNYLVHLRESNWGTVDLKWALETAFDLEFEVYRALQTARRVNDIRITYRKIANASYGFGLNTNAVRRMHDVLEGSIESFVFETVRNDFEYRIFPFYEDVTPFRPENLEASIKGLEIKEEKYRKYFKHASFDPATCSDSCQPFYVWSIRDIRRQRQDIQKFFQGGSLFLFADPKNGFHSTVKSKNFRIRFVSNVAELEEIVKGTGILLQPATFSYITFRNRIYLSPIENTFFEHFMGQNSPDQSNNVGTSLISPYTLWRIQLMNVSRDFDMAVNFVEGIELVGEGEIVADDTGSQDYVKISKPEEWEYEDVYLSLL